jgi:basic membrane protein A
MKRVDQAIFDIVKQLKENKFQGGQTLFLGLKESAVDISPSTSRIIKPEILELVSKLKKDIIEGKIKPPNSKETYTAWEKTLK